MNQIDIHISQKKTVWFWIFALFLKLKISHLLVGKTVMYIKADDEKEWFPIKVEREISEEEKQAVKTAQQIIDQGKEVLK